MDSKQWTEATLGKDTVTEAAVRAGIPKATAWRQYNNDCSFTAENVILLARAYGKDPVEALVAFGYLRDDERGIAAKRHTLQQVADQELIEELSRRLKERPEQTEWGQPIIIDTQVLAAKYGDTEREQEAFEELP